MSVRWTIIVAFALVNVPLTTAIQQKAAVAEIFNSFSRNLEMSLTLEELVMDGNEFDKVE